MSIPNGRMRWLVRPLLELPTGIESLRARLLLLAFWFVLGAMETAKELTSARLQQVDRPVSDAILVNFPWWFFWAFGTLLVIYLARRWPIDRGRSLPAVLRHATAAALIAGTHLTLVAVLIYFSVARGGSTSVAELGPQIRFWIQGYIVIDFFVYWMVLGAYYALVYHQQYVRGTLREAEALATAARHEADAVSARLTALQMELNPHFLFNSLNAVSGLVDEGRNNEATKVISRLGELLRTTLHRGRVRGIELDRELDFIRLYLGMEQVRFGSRLHFEIAADADVRSAVVPPMILQPLVENAVRHGVSARPGPARILVSAKRDGAMLRIEVLDDGPGLDQESGRTGTGLPNIRERLATLYGEDAGLAVGAGPGGGVRAEIRLPIRQDARAVHDELDDMPKPDSAA